MQTFLKACHDAVIDNEAKSLADKMGMPHVSLLQRANPDNDAHKLTINHLYQILLHTGDMRPLQALAESFGFEMVAKESAQAQNLPQAVLHMHAEVADVTKAVTEAMADGRLCQTEKALIKREIAGAREALDVLDQSVKAA